MSVTVRIDTPYGPLDARIYAGPTSVPATTYARDGEQPTEAHVFGRDPKPYVGARVSSPGYYEPDAFEAFVVNGVSYKADQSFTLAGSGWAEERGGIGGALNRTGSWSVLGDDVTPAARKAWHDTVVPLVLAALADCSQEVTQAEAEAHAEFAADATKRIAQLRAEADRLSAMIGG